MVEELFDGRLLLQKLDNGTVFACVWLIFGIAARVGESTAVEYETAAIAGGIGGEPFFVTERKYGYSEGTHTGTLCQLSGWRMNAGDNLL